MTGCRGDAPRRGATTVEMAVVAPVIFMLLFAIIEYGRFVFVYTTATNAARDGARYALAHTNDGTTTAQVLAVIDGKMGGTQNTMGNYTRVVMYADPAALALNPPVLQDYGTNPAPDGWQKTPFPDCVAVVITFDYYPVLTQFLNTGTGSVPVKLSAVMTSEGSG